MTAHCRIAVSGWAEKKNDAIHRYGITYLEVVGQQFVGLEEGLRGRLVPAVDGVLVEIRRLHTEGKVVVRCPLRRCHDKLS